MEAFAAQTGVAIQNARLFSSLRREGEGRDNFAQMAEGAVFFDPSGAIVLANPAAGFCWVGRRRDAEFWELMGRLLRSGWMFAGGENLAGFEATRTEGKTLVMAGLIKIQSDKGEWIGSLAVFRDVTAEKKGENETDFLSLMSHKLKTPLVAITGIRRCFWKMRTW